VITVKFGSYPQQTNFPALLGQAFIAHDMPTPEELPLPADALMQRDGARHV
jgi:hypothetical protein